MRTGLFLGTLLATALIGGTALADQSSDDSNYKPYKGQEIKERVLEKQREGFKSSKSTETSGAKVSMKEARTERSRPRGEIYGDQATRSTAKSQAAMRGKNLSASNSVNNPSEIAAMKRMINPMLGAYRTSQANEGTDSYGGNEDSKMKSGSGSRAKNLSATGSVNNPSEIAAMMKMVAPLKGAYSVSAASEGCDSYGGRKEYSPFAQSKGTTSVHFKNDKGELIGKTTGENKAAARSTAMRERLHKAIGEKMSKKSTVEHEALPKTDTRMGK
ncbi:MAG: hypothetical protein JNK04_17715 [Myxococcales bacterium]|nr:hypothetical protein [Myxococcales bacterium]